MLTRPAVREFARRGSKRFPRAQLSETEATFLILYALLVLQLIRDPVYITWIFLHSTFVYILFIGFYID
jgi:hypothetical protein